MKPLKNKVSITLDEDLIQKIKKMAEDDDRSFKYGTKRIYMQH